MNPLINILIRVSRPKLFAERCLPSIVCQTYPFTQIHTYENDGSAKGFSYNLFLNELKDRVKEGWFFILDDDDRLATPTVLTEISRHLVNPDQPVICQFLRNGKPKPTDGRIENKEVLRGRIGMPSLFLHAKHKNIAMFNETEDADYQFIKTVSEKLACKFVKLVVVDAGGRSYGVAPI